MSISLQAFLTETRSCLRMKAPLDLDFIPAARFASLFEDMALVAGSLPVSIALERAGGLITGFKTVCFKDDSYRELNIFHIERIVKSLLWAYGGFKLTIGGAPGYIIDELHLRYSPSGSRAFDYDFVETIFDRPLEIASSRYEDVPEPVSSSNPVGRHLDGCRLGFDAGGSDIKISAVIDGECVFSEEVVWHPKVNTDPDYHFEHIVDVMKKGAAQLPKVDAVGISSAGVYINNLTRIASLFIKVPKPDFDAKVKDIYVRAVRTLGDNIPFEVANDGDVTALAGAMDLDDTNVLGIAMGTSEAAGFVDGGGNITGFMNELAFVPCDYNPGAMIDEWSGDIGCGVKYFSQDAVAKLAPAAGITFSDSMTPAEKLKHVQGLMGKEKGAEDIYRTIGVYLGYGIAWYARFYDIKHVLTLGRVTSGDGGQIILSEARRVLDAEFPELSIELHLPDESSRRVGQSIAAASLPQIVK